MRLIFLGPPGAGKSTQAAILASQWQIPHICTGEMLRQAIARRTAMGLKAQPYVESGELVPDRLMLAMMYDRLRQSDTRRGWILDGFPRNSIQADAFDDLMKSLRQSGDRSILFYVTFDIAIKRLLDRGHPDSTIEAIYKHLARYEEQMTPLIDRYQKRRQITVINGNRPVETITQYMQTVLPVGDRA